MSLKDFLELKQSKSPKEFKEWFDRTACWCVDVYGHKILCAKISNRKAFLRDGTIIEVGEEERLKCLSSDEFRDFRVGNEIIEKYAALKPEHRIAVYRQIGEFFKEEEEERERQKNAYCSFCGRTKKKVKKLIAGPNGMFICDRCVKECSELLKEES